jgi:hypothetical protein
MKKLNTLAVLALATFPMLAFAQFQQTNTLIKRIGDIVGNIIPILIGLALLVFFWGLAKFILKLGGDAKAAEEGKKLMIWGLVALFVMISVWGLVAWLQHELLPSVGQSEYGAPTNIKNIVPKP